MQGKSAEKMKEKIGIRTGLEEKSGLEEYRSMLECKDAIYDRLRDILNFLAESKESRVGLNYVKLLRLVEAKDERLVKPLEQLLDGIEKLNKMFRINCKQNIRRGHPWPEEAQPSSLERYKNKYADLGTQLDDFIKLAKSKGVQLLPEEKSV